jgi:hypothetical protein
MTTKATPTTTSLNAGCAAHDDSNLEPHPEASLEEWTEHVRSTRGLRGKAAAEAARKARRAATAYSPEVFAQIEALPRGEYTVVVSEEYEEKANEIARGRFQRRLVAGVEALSAMTVANNYRGRYVQSGRNFMDRLRSRGIACSVARGRWNKNVFVIGE